jgi:hypothetical protein
VNYAVAGGNISIIGICDDCGCDFSDSLTIAVDCHHFNTFQWLFSSKAPPRSPIVDLMNVAARANDLDTLLFCLERGADVNARDSRKSGPLHWAAGIKEIDALKLLLAVRGVNVNLRDAELQTPLYIAVVNENCRGIWLLLDQPEIDVNTASGFEHMAPIHEAARLSNPQLFSILLKFPGLDVNVIDHVYFLGHLVSLLVIQRLRCIRRSSQAIWRSLNCCWLIPVLTSERVTASDTLHFTTLLYTDIC